MLTIKIYLVWGEFMILATMYHPDSIKAYQSKVADLLKGNVTIFVVYWLLAGAMMFTAITWPFWLYNAVKSKRG